MEIQSSKFGINPHHHETYKKRKITISKYLIVLVTTTWLWPLCTSRPLSPLPLSRGIEKNLNNDNASMVVRIVVSSSSSSSTSDSDFAHLFTSSSSTEMQRRPTYEIQREENQDKRPASKSQLPNPSYSFTQSNFSRNENPPAHWKQQQLQHRLSSPSINHPIFQIFSQTSKSSETTNNPSSSRPTTTITPIPTTYRPKVRLRASPLLFFLATTTTTTTTTTIKPLPFREDIFSVFYRAFSQQSHDSSSSSFLAFKSPHPRSSNVDIHSSTISDLERQNNQFQNPFQNSPRKIPSIPNPFQNLPITTKDSQNQIQHQQAERPQTQLEDSKVVTSVVTRSSSVNVNYPRIRPSSFMILSMAANSHNNSSNLSKNLNNSTQLGSNYTKTGSKVGMSTDTEDIREPLIDWSSREFSIPKKNSSKIFESKQNSSQSLMENGSVRVPGNLENQNFQISDSDSENPINFRNFHDEQSAPKAEALIQFKNEHEDSERKITNANTNSKQTLKSEVNKYWQPEQNWSEPAKVWGEPAKIWGQSEQNWGVQSQPHSHLQQQQSTVRPIQEEPKQTQSKELWGKTHGNEGQEVVHEDASLEELDDEDENQGGTFYELGEDEDDLPSDTIPPELASQSQQQQGRRGTNMANGAETGGRNSPRSWELPELTPQVDHSFVDSSSRSVEVAESIQVSLKREMDFRMRSPENPNSNSKGDFKNGHVNQENLGGGIRGTLNRPITSTTSSKSTKSGTKFGYVLDGNDVRKYRVEERTPDGFIVGEYGVLNNDNRFLRGVRYTADGTINPRLIHEALMKFLSL